MIRIDVVVFILLGLIALGCIGMVVCLILLIRDSNNYHKDIHCNNTGVSSMDDTVITTIPYDKTGLE